MKHPHWESTETYQKPERTPGTQHDDWVETHPSYGQISAHRVQGYAALYGSDFAHHNYITLEVNYSQVSRGLNQDHPFARGTIVKLAMSEAQWARFVSTLNVGEGTQCTLSFTEKQGHVPQLPRPQKRNRDFEQELADTLREAEAALGHLKKCIEEKAGKKTMQSAIWRMENALTPNMTFLAKQFGEHWEQTTERAKIEVSSYLTATVQRAGLKALGATAPIALLDDDTKEDGQ